MASEESGGQNRPPQRHISWPPPAPESHAFQEANAGQVPRGYKFSPEEVKAFQECRSEAIWRRGLPFATVLIGAKQLLVMRGIGKSMSYAKGLGLGCLGLLGGMVSYQPVCREKILAIPGSELAEMIRSGKSPNTLGTPGPGQGFGSGGIPVSPDLPASSAARQSESGNSHLNMDNTYRPPVSTDSFQQPLSQAPQGQPEQRKLSYDELRRQNRAEYDRRMASQTAPLPSQPPGGAGVQPPSYQPPSYQQPYEPPQSKTRQKTNQYGDVIED